MTEVKVENGLYYQSFVGESDLNNVAELDKRIRQSREQPPETETRRDVYKRAGLTALVREIEPSPDEVRRLEAERPLRMLGLAPMTNEELRTWHTWLPTAYIGSTRDDSWGLYRRLGEIRANRLDMPRDLSRMHLMNRLSEYRYSDVPLEVAEKMHTLGDKFDYLYILTPEGRYEDARRLEIIDPVLVGVRNEQHWLLARWGEVDPNVVSYDKLRDARWLEDWTRRRYNRRISVRQELLPITLFSLLVGVATGMLGMMAAVLMDEALGWITKERGLERGLWIVAGASTLGVVGFHLVAWRKNLARAAGKAIARWRYPGVEKLL